MTKQEIQKYSYGWCSLEDRMTEHVSAVNPTGDWVCTQCRQRVAELKAKPGDRIYI